MPDNNNPDRLPAAPRGRLLISGVLLLFALAAMLCAASALFLKYRLEHARSFSTAAIRDRVGVEFGFGALRAEGLRTLRVADLHIAAPAPGVGRVSLDVNDVRVRLSFLDLLQGRAVVGKAYIDGGRVVVDRTGVQEIRRRSGAGGGLPAEFSPALIPPVALSATNCALEVRLSADAAPLLFEDITFEFENRPAVPETNARFTAHATVDGNTSVLAARARYRGMDSFEADIDIADLTAEHVATGYALPEGISGRLSTSVRLSGQSGQRITAQVEAQLHEAHGPLAGLPMTLPFDTIEGTLRALLQWDGNEKRMEVHTCEIKTDLATLSASGMIDLGEQPPSVDLHAVLTDLSVESLLPDLLPEALTRVGAFEASLPEGVEIRLDARGRLPRPELVVYLAVPEALLAFTPTDPMLPRGNLRIERVNMYWSDFSALPTGVAMIVGGKVAAERFGVSAEDLMGTLYLEADGIALRPMTATVSGRPWSGKARYNIPSGDIAFEINGALTDIEQTPLHDLVEKLWLSGDIAFRGGGSYSPGGRLQFNASADVTRGGVAFEWWLNKPVGVGASIHTIDVLIEPGKKLEVSGEAAIEDTTLLAKFDYIPHQGKWQTHHIRLDIPHLEVNSAGKCIQMPYTAVGGACRDGFYEWKPTGNRIGDHIATLGGHFDYVSFLPDGGDNPLICHDASVTITLTNIEEIERTGEIVVHAGTAHVPPFGDDWLLPLGPDDPEYVEKYPDGPPRPMTYKLSADNIFVPPWEGRNFSAEVYSNKEETGFHFFRAECGNGRLEGTHRHEKEDNVLHLRANWEAIPAAYLIRHLELPEVLAGDITGEIQYVVDQDDPRATTRADGHFIVERGHFIPEQLGHILMDEIGGSIIALHPDALAFDKVAAKLRIDGDKIHTNDVLIQSGGITISGNGLWVMDGDLDYRVDVAVSPDLAEQIPILRDNFNVQGFRMTQRNIELGFHITGPTFRPTGQLAGLPPVGVTLVSGAAEMTGEAIRFFDMPRQMFMSVFRIGGGILGATRTQQQQQQQQ